MAVLMLMSLFLGTIGPWPISQAQAQSLPFLPQPGSMMSISPSYDPLLMKGIKLDPQQPLRFDFIIDTGQTNLQEITLRQEATRLIKYFLASMTVPEDEMWVNLSPYEHNRIIPEAFGITEMGRDLLTQDYLLKQITASLIYPENDLGREFWQKVYQRAYELYGTTDIPTDTFNKVWIIPDTAKIYREGEMVYLLNSHLKVMLEEDYVAMAADNDVGAVRPGAERQVSEHLGARREPPLQNEIAANIIREIILPELEKEINEGKNFANLRQIYHSMILATWFKRNLKDSLLGKYYAEQNKVDGIDIEDKQTKEKIYQQYLEAFKRGVFDYIKEDYDPLQQDVVARKYFSGGMWGGKAIDFAMVTQEEFDQTIASNPPDVVVTADFVPPETKPNDAKSDLAELTPEGFFKNSTDLYDFGRLFSKEPSPEGPFYVKLLKEKSVWEIFTKLFRDLHVQHHWDRESVMQAIGLESQNISGKNTKSNRIYEHLVKTSGLSAERSEILEVLTYLNWNIPQFMKTAIFRSEYANANFITFLKNKDLVNEARQHFLKIYETSFKNSSIKLFQADNDQFANSFFQFKKDSKEKTFDYALQLFYSQPLNDLILMMVIHNSGLNLLNLNNFQLSKQFTHVMDVIDDIELNTGTPIKEKILKPTIKKSLYLHSFKIRDLVFELKIPEVELIHLLNGLKIIYSIPSLNLDGYFIGGDSIYEDISDRDLLNWDISAAAKKYTRSDTLEKFEEFYRLIDALNSEFTYEMRHKVFKEFTGIPTFSTFFAWFQKTFSVSEDEAKVILEITELDKLVYFAELAETSIGEMNKLFDSEDVNWGEKVKTDGVATLAKLASLDWNFGKYWANRGPINESISSLFNNEFGNSLGNFVLGKIFRKFLDENDGNISALYDKLEFQNIPQSLVSLITKDNYNNLWAILVGLGDNLKTNKEESLFEYIQKLIEKNPLLLNLLKSKNPIKNPHLYPLAVVALQIQQGNLASVIATYQTNAVFVKQALKAIAKTSMKPGPSFYEQLLQKLEPGQFIDLFGIMEANANAFVSSKGIRQIFDKKVKAALLQYNFRITNRSDEAMTADPKSVTEKLQLSVQFIRDNLQRMLQEEDENGELTIALRALVTGKKEVGGLDWDLKEMHRLGLIKMRSIPRQLKAYKLLELFKEELIATLEKNDHAIQKTSMRFRYPTRASFKFDIIEKILPDFNAKKSAEQRRRELEEAAKEEISHLIEELIPRNAEHLVRELHVTLSNLIFRALGPKLKDTNLEQDRIRELVEQELFSGLEQLDLDEPAEKFKPGNTSISGAEAPDGLHPIPIEGTTIAPAVELKTTPLTKNDVHKMSNKMDRLINESTMDDNAKFEVRTQAYDAIRELIELEFLHDHYTPDPNQDTLINARRALEKAAEAERIKAAQMKIQDQDYYSTISKVYSDFLRDVNEALTLQEELYKSGLHSSVTLNLPQLMADQKFRKNNVQLNASDMGLGKTLQGLSAFLLSGENELIVTAPGQIISRWIEEIAKRTDTKIELVVLYNKMDEKEIGRIIDQNLPEGQKGKNLIQYQTIHGRAKYSYLLSPRPQPPTDTLRIILANYQSAPRLQTYRNDIRHRKKLLKANGYINENGIVQGNLIEVLKKNNKEPLPASIQSGQTNVEQIKNYVNLLPGHIFAINTRFFISDESHELVKRSGQSLALLGEEMLDGRLVGGVEAPNKILLTGTPIINTATDLFRLLKFLAINGTSDIEQRLARMTRREFNSMLRIPRIKPGTSDDEIARIILKNIRNSSTMRAYLLRVMVRWLKKDVVRQLPEIREVMVKLDMFTGQMRYPDSKGELISIQLPGNYGPQYNLMEELRINYSYYKKYVFNRNGAAKQGSTSASHNRLLQIMRLEMAALDPGNLMQQEMDSIKIDAVVELVRNLLANNKTVTFDFGNGQLQQESLDGESAVIFSRYQKVINTLTQRLIQEFGEERVLQIDGTVPVGIRQQRLERFQGKKNKAAVGLGTVQVLAQGIEMTNAGAVIKLHPFWTPDQEQQSSARVYRPDSQRHYQGKIITVYNFEIDLPVSIDKEKRLIVKRKNEIIEMMLKGNLVEKIVKILNLSQKNLIERLGINDGEEALDNFELSLVDKLQERVAWYYQELSKIFGEQRETLRQKMWEQLSVIYSSIVYHKASFFANMAIFDALTSEDLFPQFKNTPIRYLDMGAATSVAELARQRVQPLLDLRQANVEVSDLDRNRQALEIGKTMAPGKRRQYAGDFNQIKQTLTKGHHNVFGFVYSYNLVRNENLEQLWKDMYTLLPENGVTLIVLPASNKPDEKFFQEVGRLGFKRIPIQSSKLKTVLTDEQYHRFVDHLGTKIANSIRSAIGHDFTFFAIEKTKEQDVSAIRLNPDNLQIRADSLRIGPKELRELNKKSKKNFQIIPLDAIARAVVGLENPEGEDHWSVLTGEKPNDTVTLTYKSTNVGLPSALANPLERIFEMAARIDEIGRRGSYKKMRLSLHEKIMYQYRLLTNNLKTYGSQLNKPQRVALIELLKNATGGWFVEKENTNIIPSLISEINKGDKAMAGFDGKNAEFDRTDLDDRKLTIEPEGGGVTLNVPLPQALASKSDKAMTNLTPTPLGGIDFDPNKLTIEEEGDKAALNIPAPQILNEAELQLKSGTGLTPVIINIQFFTPATLPVLLGLKRPYEEKEAFPENNTARLTTEEAGHRIQKRFFETDSVDDIKRHIDS